MEVKNLFTDANTAQEKVKLANDLLLINHLTLNKIDNIDNIDKIDDKFFKSITSTGGDKKNKVLQTIKSFLDTSSPLVDDPTLDQIKEAAEEISKTIKLKDNFLTIANDLLLINHLKHIDNIDNIDNIDDKFFKSITSTGGEKKDKVLQTIKSFLDTSTKLDDGADLDQIKEAAGKISEKINLTDLFSKEGIPLNNKIRSKLFDKGFTDLDYETKNKLFDKGFTAKELIESADKEITQGNLKLDLRLPRLLGKAIDILKDNTLSKEDETNIVRGITSIIEKAGQDENKKNVVAAILPIVSLLEDNDFKNNKDAIFNSLIKRSYKEEAIKSIFTEEDVGKTKIYNARNSDYSSYQRERKIKQEVGLNHSGADFAKHYAVEAAFYSAGSVVSLVEGLTRGFVALIDSAVSIAGFKSDFTRDHQVDVSGSFDNLTKSHSWSRVVRNQISRDGGHDLEQEGGVAHLVLKGARCGVGVMVGSSFGVLAGGCALIAKAVDARYKKVTGSHDKKTDFNTRLSVENENKVDIKISEDKKNIEFTDEFQDKIQEKQQQQKDLIKISERQKCYIGVGLKFNTSSNKVDANNGYIEVNDVFRDNDEDGKKIKKGDKISKITVGGKEIDFINSTFKEGGKVTDINLDDVGEKLAELLLKTPRDENVSLTVFGKDESIELKKKVFIKNEGGRKLSDGLNHDFVSIDKANDKDITLAFNKFNDSETTKPKAKSPPQTIRQAIATPALAHGRGSR